MSEDTMKREYADFEASIRIKEEISDVQPDNSDLNSFVELSEVKIENCENSLENYVGVNETKVENCENSLEDLKELEEDPLNINSALHERKKVFQCNICNRGFKHRTSLCQHIDRVHEKDIVKCAICDIDLKPKNSIHQHMRQFHLQYKKKNRYKKKNCYKCDTCDLKGFTIQGFKKHMLSIHGKEIEKFLTIKKSKIDEGPAENSGGANKPKLEKDEVNSPIKCKFVFLKNPSTSQTSITTSKLRNQIETVHEKTKIQRESCDLSNVPNSLLERHVETSKKDPLNVNSNQNGIVKCLICGIYLKHQDSYNQHMRSFHLQYEKKSHYKCDTCNFQGLNIEGFKRHMLSIHGKKIVNVKTFNKSKMDNGPVENSGGAKQGSSPCAKKPKLEQDEVNSPIKSKSVFLENPSTVHEKTKFTCESCDLSYVSNSLLESHVEKFHLGNNLFRMIDLDQFWVDRK